ncbi:MAG: RidA family protein, partial [Actinomycetota bacterium]|nr:RidA family protein [Actinomycetota bacterium]
MDKKVVSSEQAPEAIGPYSQAVTTGETIYCSGQVPLDPASGELVEGSVADQTRRCMENLRAVLEAGGSSFDKVVKVTAYLTDMNDFPEFNDAYGEYFPQDPPARATVGVAAEGGGRVLRLLQTGRVQQYA